MTKPSKSVSRGLPHNTTSSTTEVTGHTRNVERIAQTAENAAKNLKTPAIEYKNVPQLYGDASLGLDKTKTIVDENGFLTRPVYGGKTVVGAGQSPKRGAYNIDYSPTPEIGVFSGDANNLTNISSNSQAKVISENPFNYSPFNSEINRIIQPGGILKTTGVKSNKFFFKGYENGMANIGYKAILNNGEIPNGYTEILKIGKIPENLRIKGFQGTGGRGKNIKRPTDLEVILKK